MFAQSAVYAQLSSGAFGKYIIIGDSGYGNTHFLCTPFSRRERPNPQAYSEADKEYQRAILTTRNTIERAFGVLKRRFPILHSGMQLQRLPLIQKIISVCCLLHNVCIDCGDTNMNDFEVLPIATPERDQPNDIPNEERRRRPNENAQPKARDVIIGIYERRLAVFTCRHLQNDNSGDKNNDDTRRELFQ